MKPGEGEGEREEGQDNLENGDAAVGAGAARTDAAAVTAGGHRRGERGELAGAGGRTSSGEGAMGSAARWTWGWSCGGASTRRREGGGAGRGRVGGGGLPRRHRWLWGAACWSWSEASRCHVACLFSCGFFFVLCKRRNETGKA